MLYVDKLGTEIISIIINAHCLFLIVSSNILDDQSSTSVQIKNQLTQFIMVIFVL